MEKMLVPLRFAKRTLGAPLPQFDSLDALWKYWLLGYELRAIGLGGPACSTLPLQDYPLRGGIGNSH